MALTAALSHLAGDEEAEAEAPPPEDHTGLQRDDDGADDEDYMEDGEAATGGAPRKFRGVWCVDISARCAAKKRLH